MSARKAAVLGALAMAGALLGAVPATAAEPAGREPILFVHGLFGAPNNFDTMSLRFRLNGYAKSELVSFGYDSTGSLTAAASQLAAKVQEVRAATGAAKVDVVTHSLGGLPSRWFVKVLDGAASVDDWISLGGPNQGGNPGTCPAPGSTACEQATKGSAFITQLNSGDPTPGSVSYTTFSSPCDTVVENEWTTLDGASNVDVGCVSHFNLVSDRDVFDEVLAATTG
ncbi:esterase/lipase family protein [Amycolatopsis magusensis]|uniref:esterase/lipase family protein n=1 Tax=Amycolatopsis magusensis TaxID=882444 RepID=UPI0024A7FDAB|nr:lipase [Amycolatopsis magusensis]MDI5979306.1 lipase [Amycolatopsis magusensis]